MVELAHLGRNILPPSEQEDKILVFLVLLIHLVLAGGQPVTCDSLQFWACCLVGVPELGIAW